MNSTTVDHRHHDGYGEHGAVAGTARHEWIASADGNFLEIEISASQDGAEYGSDDNASALLRKSKQKAKTTIATTITVTKKRQHYKLPGIRTILLNGLFLVTLASLSTVVKEAWTWDPARISGQWSNALSFQDQRVTTTAMYLTSTQKRPRTEFFVARQPRTVFFSGTPWMKQARPTNHSHSNTSSSSTRVYYPIKLLPPALRNNVTNSHDDDDDDDNNNDDDDNNDDDVTRFYPTVDSQDTSMERRKWPQHELDPHCEPMADWQTNFYPVCNELHGTDMTDSLVDDDLQLLSSKGFWRHAWQMDDEVSQNTTTVLKTFKLAHNMEEAFFENNRVDAVAMERLTASPWVVNIYALCGMSVVTEYAGKELADVARHLNASQRLDLAVQVSQGVADVHSIDGGNKRPSLVHNDLNLANLVLTPDNRPVLNDFNIAILLMKHNETGETCPFASHFPNPQWRGPEEQVGSEYESDRHPPIVTEKIDIYALGNVFYRLAVGASPWKRPGSKKVTPDEKVEIARLKRTNGMLPAIPDDILSSPDPAVQVLLQAMYLCYQFDPMKRPTAAQVVTMLSRSSASIRAGSHGRRLARNQTW